MAETTAPAADLARVRAPTSPERQLLASVAAVRDPSKMLTLVSVKGGLGRRRWPQLAQHHHHDKEIHP